jgi:copper chaperone
MKNNYQITGMSCGGCVNAVKQALMNISNVEDVEVKLHPPVAVITMSNYIDVSQLQKQLSNAGHYSIKELG